MKPNVDRALVTSPWYIWLLFMLGLLFTACQQESKGFVLPPGDVATGQLLFAELSCTDCHSITGIAWTGTGSDPEVKLGGELTKLKTYGELVTSVINPSHKISQKALVNDKWLMPEGASKMETYCYNEVMTVQQLIDIIAFIQSEYRLKLPVDSYPYH
jgi:L-cysteine S-thiosulfotransferase